MKLPEELFPNFAQMATHARRGSALSPLNWLIASLGAMATATLWSGKSVLIYGTWIGLALAVITYLVIYIYLVINKPDLTRSEHFTLEKLRIELLGDSRTGLVEESILDGEVDDSPIEAEQGRLADAQRPAKSGQLPEKSE